MDRSLACRGRQADAGLCEGPWHRRPAHFRKRRPVYPSRRPVFRRPRADLVATDDGEDHGRSWNCRTRPGLPGQLPHRPWSLWLWRTDDRRAAWLAGGVTGDAMVRGVADQQPDWHDEFARPVRFRRGWLEGGARRSRGVPDALIWLLSLVDDARQPAEGAVASAEPAGRRLG